MGESQGHEKKARGYQGLTEKVVRGSTKKNRRILGGGEARNDAPAPLYAPMWDEGKGRG